MADDRTTITQDQGDRLALDHGGIAVYGDAAAPSLRHDVGGVLVHSTGANQPLVHMVCWDQEPCDVTVTGRVTLAGDPGAPFDLRVRHEFPGDHHQTHVVEPVEHTLHVDTALAAPVHHALQMRTPLQLRFCNPWHTASDYQVEISIANKAVISLRLTGGTVATPQPCPEDECPPSSAPAHP